MSTDPNNLTDEQWRRSYRAAKTLEAVRLARRARLDAEAEHIETPDEIEAVIATRDFRWTDGPVTRWDLGRFEKNPVVLDNHDDRALPVGSCTSIRVDERGDLVARVRFARTERGQQIAALIRDRQMRGFSPRFLHRRDGSGELIEISAVAIPRDPDARVIRNDAKTKTPPARLDAAPVFVERFDILPLPRNTNATNERKRTTMNHDSNDNNDTIAKARARRDALAANAWKNTTDGGTTTRADAEDDPEGIAARRARRDELAANAWKDGAK